MSAGWLSGEVTPGNQPERVPVCSDQAAATIITHTQFGYKSDRQFHSNLSGNHQCLQYETVLSFLKTFMEHIVLVFEFSI